MRSFRHLTVATVIAVVMVLFASVVPGSAEEAAPRWGRGDNFYAPAQIPRQIVNSTWRGTNWNATKQPPCEPNHAGNVGGRSIWFRFVGHRHRDLVVLQTYRSNFDTLLAVYRGSNLCNLRRVASNDDDPGHGLKSRVEFVARPNTNYRVVVDGYNGAGGQIALRIRRIRI